MLHRQLAINNIPQQTLPPKPLNKLKHVVVNRHPWVIKRNIKGTWQHRTLLLQLPLPERTKASNTNSSSCNNSRVTGNKVLTTQHHPLPHQLLPSKTQLARTNLCPSLTTLLPPNKGLLQHMCNSPWQLHPRNSSSNIHRHSRLSFKLNSLSSSRCKCYPNHSFKRTSYQPSKPLR